MAVRKFGGWKKNGPAPEPPPLLDNTEELLDEFERTGILQVPALDGSGTYTFVNANERGFANIKGLPVVLYWDGEKHGGTVHPDYFTSVKAKEYGDRYGAELAFSLKLEDLGWKTPPRTIVATVLQFIQSGRPIHMQDCGHLMSVTNGLGSL